MLQNIWEELRVQYFPDRHDLSAYQVSWSTRRQKRVLASISLRKKRVRVAQELNHPKQLHWLQPLLYHEMCHAVIGETVQVHGRRRLWHGKAFKLLEQAHPQMKEFERWIALGGWRGAVMSARVRSFWRRKAA